MIEWAMNSLDVVATNSRSVGSCPSTSCAPPNRQSAVESAPDESRVDHV